MLWVPTDKFGTTKDAFPAAIGKFVINGAFPSRNVTVPVAAAGDIVAVKVTDWPTADGLMLELIVMVAVGLTSCISPKEVLPLSLASPL
jgi:hypothetical protein